MHRAPAHPHGQALAVSCARLLPSPRVTPALNTKAYRALPALRTPASAQSASRQSAVVTSDAGCHHHGRGASLELPAPSQRPSDG
eukprot:2856835-Prymnesium_polylepis.1